MTARFTAPLMAAAALFVAAGGYVHLREWVDTYRHVPAEASGAAVVRVGFPINAAVSALLTIALAYNAWRRTRYASHVIVAALTFQAISLGVLVTTRTGTFFGWSEPSWTTAADQTRAVQIGALVMLAAIPGITAVHRFTSSPT